jgi:hypothetical protein
VFISVVELSRDHVLNVLVERSVRAEDEVAQDWNQRAVLASQLVGLRGRSAGTGAIMMG